MNIACVICSELFISGADVYFTQCGHVFHYHCLISWLERSKTCPQCRTKVTERTIHKVYFNISNVDHQRVDPATLMCQLDNANFTLTLKDKELKDLKDNKKKMKEQNRALREEIATLENNARGMDSTMHAFKDQILYFKSKAKETDRLSEEIVKLKSTIRNMENIDAVVNGTREQVNNILRDEHNVESLALLAATLKKALLDSEKKLRDTDYNLKKSKNELSRLKKDFSSREAQNADMRRELQQIKLKTENEKNILKQRLKSASINNIVVTNPEADSLLLTSMSESNLDASHNRSNKKQDMTLNMSLTVDERVDNIINSDSPYLPVKSSFGSFLDTKFQAPSNMSGASFGKGYSIFKTNQKLAGADKGTKGDEIVYDGLGGSHKTDVYPSPKPRQTGLKRNKSSSSVSSRKFKKLAPSANSKNKITEFIDISD